MNESDLDFLIGKLDELSNITTDSTEIKVNDISSNINLLDEDKNGSDSILVTPSSILEDYTTLEKEKKDLEKQKLDFENENRAIFDQYNAILNEIQNKTNEQSELKDKMTESMENSGLKTMSNDMFKVTFVAATTRDNFEKDKFKKKYPVLFNEFITTSSVKSYVKIKEI